MPRDDESLEEMVQRRNKRLLYLFSSNGYNVQIIGDPQKPAVVLDEMVVLSCYVKNFDLHFTKEPFSENIVKSFKLKSQPEVTKLELQEAIEQSTHRPVYKLKLDGTGLLLVGWNYLNSEDSIGRYPVFAKEHPKIYFDREFAINLAEGLKKEGYSTSIA